MSDEQGTAACYYKDAELIESVLTVSRECVSNVSRLSRVFPEKVWIHAQRGAKALRRLDDPYALLAPEEVRDVRCLAATLPVLYDNLCAPFNMNRNGMGPPEQLIKAVTKVFGEETSVRVFKSAARTCCNMVSRLEDHVKRRALKLIVLQGKRPKEALRTLGPSVLRIAAKRQSTL